MKKAIISTLMFAAMVIVVPSADASVTTASVTPTQQIVIQPSRYRNRRTRTITTTRIRWDGRYRYRETIRTTYFANGRTRTVVVNRVRLSGRRVYRNY